MPHKPMLAETYAFNLEMIKMTLADFSDSDMLCRPAPKANHALWQLGHMINSETRLLEGIAPGTAPALPEGFGEKFGMDAVTCNDPAAFGHNKDQLLELFANVRGATIDWIKTVKLPELDKPAPEQMRSRFPTVGHIAMLIYGHATMHGGQMQVIRRVLGKPVLF